MEIGTVIATSEDPDVFGFTFLAKREIKAGSFVGVGVPQGKAFAVITNIVRTNQYFASPEIVRGFELRGSLADVMPAQHWECWLAKARFVGVSSAEGFDRVLAPPSPGEKVFLVSADELSELLGLAPAGVEIGVLRTHPVPARLDLTRLFQKHVAILAMSGAGKSNCAQVLVEEILARKPDQGRPAVIVMDVHGEYGGLHEEFPSQAHVLDGRHVRIGLSTLSAERLREFVPEMSGAQMRELKRVLFKLKQTGRSFDLDDVLAEIERAEDLTRASKQALVGWIYDLKSLHVFDRFDFPFWPDVVVPGAALIVNLSRITSLRKKQILVTHALWELFRARERRHVPPVVVFLEEAHLFAPSENAISKRVIERIAREGRKFHFSLVVISQRPVRLSTTLLSQVGSNIIMRITNPYDLDHLRRSSEAITSQTADMISSLSVGEALVFGEAVNYPIFVRIRKKKGRKISGGHFEQAAIDFERSMNLIPRESRLETPDHVKNRSAVSSPAFSPL